MKTLENIFSEEFISAIGWTLLHSLWQGALIALLLGVGLLFLQKKSSTLRYNLGASAIVITFLAFLSTFTYLYQNTLNSATLDETVLVVVDATGATEAAMNTIENQSWLSVFTDYFNHHLPVIVVLWLLGVMVLSLRFLGGLAYLERLKHSQNRPLEALWQEKMNAIKNTVGVQQSIELLESALIKVPMVVGYFKPIILLPIGTVNALSTAEVEAILAHELAHIRRNDYLINLIQSIIDVLFFYHPAVWWMSNTVRAERENCCDDLALSVTGNSLIIAKALANLEAIRMSNHQLSVAFTGNKNQLLNRISRLLGQPMKKNNQFLESIIAIFIILICLTTVNYNVNANTNTTTDIINVEATIDTVKPLSTTLKIEKIANEQEEEIIEEYIIIEDVVEKEVPVLTQWVTAKSDLPKSIEPSNRFFWNENNQLEAIDLKALKSNNFPTIDLPNLPQNTSISLFGEQAINSFPSDGNFTFELNTEGLNTTFENLEDIEVALLNENATLSSSFFTEKDDNTLEWVKPSELADIQEIKVIKNLVGSVADTSILEKYGDADIIFIDGDKTVIIRKKKEVTKSDIVLRGRLKKTEKEAKRAQIRAKRLVLEAKKERKAAERLAKTYEKQAQKRLEIQEKQAKAHQKQAEERAKLAQIRAEKIVIRERKRQEREVAKVKRLEERVQQQVKIDRKRFEKEAKKREADLKELEAEFIKDGILKKGKRIKTLDVNNKSGQIKIKLNGKKIPEDKLEKYIKILERQQAEE